jgi:hypothetical protein
MRSEIEREINERIKTFAELAFLDIDSLNNIYGLIEKLKEDGLINNKKDSMFWLHLRPISYRSIDDIHKK